MATNKRLIKSNDEGGGVVPTSFNTVIWSGDGNTDRSIDVGFAPDWVWVKERNPEGLSHNMYDVVRGAGQRLISNLTAAENTLAEGVKSFDLNGFTVGNSIAVNRSGSTFVAWCWKAGGAAVTNTDGTITSQVSANTEAGFSIVSYTGNQLSNQTIGHGLGKTPDMIITKGRANLSLYDQWDVWHKDLTLNYILSLSSTAAEGFAGVDQRFVTSLNSDTVFGVGWDDFGPNSNGTTKIAYCFAEVAGFSKFGSYVGNGSTNVITTGFEPAFVIIKAYTSADNWVMIDNKRGVDNRLYADLSNAEDTLANRITFDANGFTLTTSAYNASGFGFIYMAFANQF